MFTITARVRNSRVEGKPGTVFYNIRNDEGERCIATGIQASREELFTVYKERLARGLGVLYRLIEELSSGTDAASLDAVASRFRDVIESGLSGMNSVPESGSPMVVRRELAVIGRGFEDSFVIVSSEDAEGADDSISSFLSARIRLARSEGRQSMARSYRSLQKALDDFRPRIRFGDFCPALLREFENYLKDKELAESSVSFYNRTLRSVLRHAETEGLITTSPDWFRCVNTSVQTNSTAERNDILDVDVLRRLAAIDLDKRPELGLVRDVFMFCFYARGMELVDAAALTGDELCDGVLYYRKRGGGVLQAVPLDEAALDIFDKYKGQGGGFMFPILRGKGPNVFAAARNRFYNALGELTTLVGSPVRLTFSAGRVTWNHLLEQRARSSII